MITYLEGRLAEKTPTYAVMDCNGVGYLLHISLNTYTRLPDSERCKVHTLLIIREDAHVLYGFADKQERQLFEQLISVSGIGAATARMMLSSLSPAELEQAIINGNVGLLKGIKGIGEKSAQRVIVDLRDKLAKQGPISEASMPFKSNIKDEALAALVMLGFAKNAAEKAVDKAMKTSEAEQSVEELIKQALKYL